MPEVVGARTVCSAVFQSPDGTQMARIQIRDSGEQVLFQLGVEGEQIGLFSCALPKSELVGLNLLGILKFGLFELDEDKLAACVAGWEIFP